MNTSTIVLLMASLIGLIWTLSLVPARGGPGRRDVLVVLCAVLWWSVCILCENLPIPAGMRLFCNHLSYFGLGLTPCFFCFLLWDVTFLGRRPIARAWLAASFLFSAALLAAALVNPGRLIERAVRFPPGNHEPPHVLSGTLFYAIVVMIYLILMAVIFYTALHQRGRSPRRRRIYAGVVLAFSAPMIVGAVNLLFDLPAPGADPTAFSLLLTAPILARLVTRNGLCDPMPIARSALLEILPDAVLVLDADARLVEANRAARLLPDVAGRPAGITPSRMGQWQSPILALIAGEPGPLLLTTTQDPPCHYEITATKLEEDGILCGHLFVVRDMTLRQNVETRLRTALDDLGVQLAANLRRQSELHGEARRDPLTSLYNRRAMDEALPALLREAAAARRPVSVAMLDIDHFKLINDNYGHHVGDEALRVFARILLAMSRPGDALFRLGGEEFLAVMPDTDTQSAVEIVMRWRHACREGLQISGRALRMTFSAGVAGTGGSSANGAMLLANADKAAYDAKRHGRDRVVVAAEDAVS